MNSIILFDGVCNLCNKTIQFVIARDKHRLFRFAALQSDFGQALLQKHQLPTTHFDSIILLEGEQIYLESTAALKIARRLRQPWPLFYGLIIIPAFIRNPIYQLISKNRYRWFGKEDSCWLPTPDLKERFLDAI